MKYPLTLTALLASIVPTAGQQVLFQEDMESLQPLFGLNTNDVGSSSGGANSWFINDAYSGGSGTLDCLGFPFSFTIPSTASQPAGITEPNGRYLHIASTAGTNSGILNCNFVAADGLCTQPGNHFARMTTDVSTLGASEATITFWWLCGGGTANYGEVYYSTDAGSTWVQLVAPVAQYRDQTTWTQQTITSPELAGHSTLRFGFRFVNGTTTSAQDPGFGVDDVSISIPEPVELGLITQDPTSTTYCEGSSITVPFAVAGTWSVGNIFTAQLSNASGSFAQPVTIGTLASTTSGSISATIPFGTPSGSGYRIRVVSSSPVFEGTINSADLSIEQQAAAGSDAFVVLCKNTGVYPLIDQLDGADPCGSWTSPTGDPYSGQFDSGSNPAGTYTYTTDCSLICPADQAQLTIALQDPANAGVAVTVPLCSNDPPTSLLPFVSGGQLTGLFFYNGMTFPMPDYTAPGTYEVVYVVYGTAPCVNDTAVMELTVNEAANAGLSTTLTICTTNGPVDLLASMTGAMTGGTWTDPQGASFSGILDPAVNGSGLYTYTVEGEAPCDADEAFVAVIVDPCLGVDEDAPFDAEWLGRSGTDQVIGLRSGAATVLLTDALGRVTGTWSKPDGTTRFELPMGDQRPGVYVVTIFGEEGRSSLRIMHVL